MQSTLSIFYFLDQIFILTEWFSVELAMAMISYTQDRVFHTDQIKVRAEFDCILCHSCILQDWYTVSPDYKQFFLSFFFFTWFHLHFQIKWLLYFKSKFMSKKIMKQIFFSSCHYSCFLDVLHLNSPKFTSRAGQYSKPFVL